MTNFSWLPPIDSGPLTDEHRHLFSVVTDQLFAICPELAAGSQHGHFTATQRDEFVSVLRKGYPYGEYSWMMTAARAVLAAAESRLSWQCAAPPIERLIRIPSARHNPRSFVERGKFSHLRHAFLASLPQTSEFDLHLRIAQLAFACIADGLTNPTHLLALQITPMTTVAHLNKLASCVAIKIQDPLFDVATTRRWIASAVPGHLMQQLDRKGARYALRVNDTDPPLTSKALHKEICIFLALIGVDRKDMPTSLAALCRWGSAFLCYYVPSVWVDYGSWVRPSVSLVDQSWNHLFSQKADKRFRATQLATAGNASTNDGIDAKASSVKVVTPPSMSSGSINLTRDWEAISAVSRPLRRLHRNEALAEISARLSAPLSPAITYLLAWCQMLLTGASQKQKSLATSSIERYFRQLAKPLAYAARDTDLARADVETLITIYSRLLENQSTPGQVAQASKILQHFHSFLTAEYAVVDIDFDDVDGFVNPKININACIIGEDDYHAARALIQSTPDASEWTKSVAENVLMIGYRAGLRRSEVRNLRIGDVQGNRLVQIRVVESKSRSGLRTIPIFDLFTSDELTILTGWRNQLINNGRSPRSFLLSSENRDDTPPSVYSGLLLVRRALVAVTG